MSEQEKKGRKPFFTLDQGTSWHPKLLPLTDRAFRVYVVSIDYSASNLLDGWISKRSGGVVAAIVGARSIVPHARDLVTAGLWLEHETDGWVIHDYHDHQPTAEYMKRLSEAGKKAARARWSKANGNANRIAGSHTDGNAQELVLELEKKDLFAVPVARDEQQRPKDASQIRNTIDQSLREAS